MQVSQEEYQKSKPKKSAPTAKAYSLTMSPLRLAALTRTSTSPDTILPNYFALPLVTWQVRVPIPQRSGSTQEGCCALPRARDGCRAQERLLESQHRPAGQAASSERCCHPVAGGWERPSGGLPLRERRQRLQGGKEKAWRDAVPRGKDKMGETERKSIFSVQLNESADGFN